MTITITQLRRSNTAQLQALVKDGQESIVTSRYKPILSLRSATATPTPTPPAPHTTNLFINPESQVNRYTAQYPQLKRIADQPQGIWVGEWSGNIWEAVHAVMEKAGDTVPVFILYNIPFRDNGNYSGGGLKNPQEYYAWVGALADAIGDKKAICVLEPDAVGLSRNIGETQRTQRLAMLEGAINALKAKPNVTVFLDASMWVPVDENVGLLRRAGLDKADGFSINVSGFEALYACLAYGNNLAQKTGKKYIVDTSRNGAGAWENPNNEADPWCNPPNRKIGKAPTFTTDNPHCVAYLWLKSAGESDGTCRGGPRAGEFWVEYALGLVT